MCKTYDLEERKNPALLVTVLSGIVVICGFVMLGVSVSFKNNKDDIFNADFGDKERALNQVKSLTFGGLLIFSLIAVFIGAAGLTCGMKPCAEGGCKRIGPILFGLSLMFVWLVYLIVGVVIGGASVTAQGQIDNFCNGETSDKM